MTTSNSIKRHQHADLIRTAWQKSVASIIETGQRLIDAKAGLEHGEFMEMIKDDLPFGDRTAEYLMEIARHPIISNSKFFANLPASWATLALLSKLPPAALEQYLHDATVSAELKHPEAKDLVDLHCIREFARGQPPRNLSASAKAKLKGVPRRFCFNRFTGEELSPAEAWDALLRHRLYHVVYLAQPNWNSSWPLWRTFPVTGRLIEQGEEALAALTELIEDLKRQAKSEAELAA